MATPRSTASPANVPQSQTPNNYPPPSLHSPAPSHPHSAQPSPTHSHPPPSFSPTLSNQPSVASTHSHLSPPSGVPNWQSKSVSEGLFDCMHSEIIRYCTAQINSQVKSDDPKLLARRLHSKIESMGFGVGQRYVERYSRDHPFLEASLDIVKFMCKEFWMVLFRKQVDKLQTNYKGIYVLHDSNFRWTSKIFALNADMDANTLVDRARVYTSLACGIIRGALWNLGLNATVKAEMQKLPAVQFTIMETRLETTSAATTTTSTAQAPPTAAAPAATAGANTAPPRSANPVTTAATVTPPHPPNTAARLRTSISANTLPTNNNTRPTTGAPATGR